MPWSALSNRVLVRDIKIKQAAVHMADGLNAPSRKSASCFNAHRDGRCRGDQCGLLAYLLRATRMVVHCSSFSGHALATSSPGVGKHEGDARLGRSWPPVGFWLLLVADARSFLHQFKPGRAIRAECRKRAFLLAGGRKFRSPHPEAPSIVDLPMKMCCQLSGPCTLRPSWPRSGVTVCTSPTVSDHFPGTTAGRRGAPCRERWSWRPRETRKFVSIYTRKMVGVKSGLSCSKNFLKETVEAFVLPLHLFSHSNGAGAFWPAPSIQFSTYFLRGMHGLFLKYYIVAAYLRMVFAVEDAADDGHSGRRRCLCLRFLHKCLVICLPFFFQAMTTAQCL